MSEIFSGMIGAILGAAITSVVSWRIHKTKQKAEFITEHEEFIRIFCNNYLNKTMIALYDFKEFNFEVKDSYKKDLIESLIYGPLLESQRILEDDLADKFPVKFIDDYRAIRNDVGSLLVRVKYLKDQDSTEYYGKFKNEIIDNISKTEQRLIDLHFKLRKIYRAP